MTSLDADGSPHVTGIGAFWGAQPRGGATRWTV
jgi:hypothetical protein